MRWYCYKMNITIIRGVYFGRADLDLVPTYYVLMSTYKDRPGFESQPGAFFLRWSRGNP